VDSSGPSPLLRASETHLEFWVQLWAPQHEKGIALLYQRRATEMTEALEHCHVRRGDRDPQEEARGDLINAYKYLMRDNNKTEPGSSQWCEEPLL